MVCADLCYTDFQSLRQTLGEPEIQYSIQLSLFSCSLSTLMSLAVAVPIGYLMSRFEFKGQSLVDAVLDIPIVLPPLVVGISLLVLFNYPPFHWLSDWVVFEIPAVVLAQFMVACAFAVRTMRVTFDQIPRRYEQVALTLGCNRSQAFWRVVFPQSYKGLLAAGTLAWARSLGEFGPILVFCRLYQNAHRSASNLRLPRNAKWRSQRNAFCFHFDDRLVRGSPGSGADLRHAKNQRMIKLQKVSIKQGDFSIEDVSLHVPAGCYAGLMGKSGCGKTSLLEAIAGLRPICSGTVTLNDQDVTHLKPASRHLGYALSGSSPISQHARWKAAGLFTRSAIHATSRDRSENSRIERFAFSRSFAESLPGWLERRRSSTRRLGTSACQSAQNTVPGRTLERPG